MWSTFEFEGDVAPLKDNPALKTQTHPMGTVIEGDFDAVRPTAHHTAAVAAHHRSPKPRTPILSPEPLGPR